MKLNFTQALMGLFAVAALSLSACGNKDDDAQPVIGNNQTGCTLTQVEADSDETTYEYNAKGYVTKMTEIEEGYEYVTTYTYDNNNKIVKETYLDEGENDGYSTYTYTNGLLTKLEYFYAGTMEYSETYTYDSNKRIKSITDVDGYKLDFTYNNAGNVTEGVVTYMEEMMYRFEYDNYDNKLTPYSVINGRINPYEPGKNNPGVVRLYFNMEGQEMLAYESTFSYQYNNKNLPTRITEDYEGDQYITNLTYQCR